MDAVKQAYATLGFVECTDSSVENGFEKIAIYAHSHMPTHAAKQLANGKWTSKLGDDDDIEHDDLNGLTGAVYGAVVLFMKRSMVLRQP